MQTEGAEVIHRIKYEVNDDKTLPTEEAEVSPHITAPSKIRKDDEAYQKNKAAAGLLGELFFGGGSPSRISSQLIPDKETVKKDAKLLYKLCFDKKSQLSEKSQLSKPPQENQACWVGVSYGIRQSKLKEFFRKLFERPQQLR